MHSESGDDDGDDDEPVKERWGESDRDPSYSRHLTYQSCYSKLYLHQ